jgi:hypothetical protein
VFPRLIAGRRPDQIQRRIVSGDRRVLYAASRTVISGTAVMNQCYYIYYYIVNYCGPPG